MTARVRPWLRRGLVVALSCCALLACIDEPTFELVGDAGAPSAQAATTSPPTTTPPSRADDGDDDAGDDPAGYAPDGGVAGPATPACGGKVCAVGFMCCKDKCKNTKAKC